MNNLDDPKFSRAIACFKLETLARQRLYSYLESCRDRYGVAGNPYIYLSGGAYPHWPQQAKQRVRRLNRLANRLNAAGWRARPSRVQMHTMRALRLQVETAVISGSLK